MHKIKFTQAINIEITKKKSTNLKCIELIMKKEGEFIEEKWEEEEELLV